MYVPGPPLPILPCQHVLFSLLIIVLFDSRHRFTVGNASIIEAWHGGKGKFISRASLSKPVKSANEPSAPSWPFDRFISEDPHCPLLFSSWESFSLPLILPAPVHPISCHLVPFRPDPSSTLKKLVSSPKDLYYSIIPPLHLFVSSSTGTAASSFRLISFCMSSSK